MDFDVFREIGLTEREIKTYVALVEIGESTAGPIAAKAKLSHSKVYETLQLLIDKGLVTYILVSKTKHFQASPPKELLMILDERKERLLHEVAELEMKAKFAKEQQETSIHEGYGAIKALFHRLVDDLSKGDYYYAFALKEDYKDATAPIFFANIHRKLADKKIIDRALAHEDIRTDISSVYSENKNIKIRFIKRSTPLGIVIVKNKVIQIVRGELPTAVETTSKQVHKQYKAFFEELWDEAKN